MQPRIAWLGLSRRKLVCDAIASQIEAWLQDWCLQRAAMVPDVSESKNGPSLANDTAAWIVESEHACILLAIDAAQVETLGRRLAAIPIDHEPCIAPDIARFALEDLLVRIASLAKLPDVLVKPWNDIWPSRVTKAEWGAFGAAITLDGMTMRLAMDRAVVDAICPGKAIHKNPLRKRAEALDSASVPLTVVLDFGEVDARDVAGLRVGEVLVSERMLGQLAALKAGGTRIAEVELRRDGTRLTAVVAASNTSQEKS